MRKFVSSLATIAAAMMVVVLLQSVASARPEYKGAWDKKYKEALKKTSCNDCHVKGEKKDKRNDFGKALVKAGLTKAAYEKDVKVLSGDAKKKKGGELFLKALEKVLKDEANAGFKKALEAGKQPAG